MLRTITIQKRLLAAFGALALMLIITGIVSVQSLSKVRAKADVVETNLLPSISRLGDVEALTAETRAMTLRLLLAIDITQEGATFERIKQLNAEKQKVSKEYESYINMDDERKLYNEFSQIDKQYGDLQTKALDFLKQEELGAAQDLLD